MTTRIEEMAGEVWRLIKDEWEEKDGKLPSGWTGIGSAYGSYSRLIEALTQAHQAGDKDGYERGRKAGIDEAVKHFVEPVAKAIYDQMSYTEQGVKPDWVQGGNSLKQDEARRLAIKALQDK